MNKYVKIAKGGFNQQCDFYPFGSYHEVDEEGWTVGKRFHAIPKEYPVELILNINEIEFKTCPVCSNKFEKDWTFIKDSCIRCYEKKNLINREEYRKAIREELKREML